MGPKNSRGTSLVRDGEGEKSLAAWLSGWNFMNGNELELNANNDDDDNDGGC